MKDRYFFRCEVCKKLRSTENVHRKGSFTAHSNASIKEHEVKVAHSKWSRIGTSFYKI